MAASRILTFTDPDSYQAAIRVANVEVYPTGRGDFRAGLMQVDLRKVWLQRGRDNLPRIAQGAIGPTRAVFEFPTRDQASFWHSGIEVSPGDIIFNHAGAVHRRSAGPCHWGTMSLTPADLSAAACALTDHDISLPSSTQAITPSRPLMARLLNLHDNAAQLARIAPERLEHPEVARALEQSLLHTMIRCLTENAAGRRRAANLRHAAIIARMEEFLALNLDRSVYLHEICAAARASERTIRDCCVEHLGIAPVRYLWLRRVHLARRALLHADPAKASVTEIATDHGFWELGRFSVRYRGLFGEPPSATLRRASNGHGVLRNRPFDLRDPDFTLLTAGRA